VSRPKLLRLVAWLFIISGGISAAGMILTLVLERRINLDLDVAGLWIGQWLLDHEPRGHRWALTLLRIGFVLRPLAGLLIFFGPAKPEVRVWGRLAGSVPAMLVIFVLGVILGLNMWQYWILQRAEMRALFDSATPQQPLDAPAA
jgi:hypothetical protein